MADIILVFPYFDTQSPQAMLFHPLGIAQLVALLRQENFDVSAIDCTFRQRNEVIAEIVAAKPRIVGIYAMVSISNNALEIARELRQQLPETLFLCGGPLPTLKPEQFLPDFQLVLRGEATQALPALCRDYLHGDMLPPELPKLLNQPDNYPGVYYQDQEDYSIILSQLQSSDAGMLNSLPIPDRSDYDHAGYQEFWKRREGFSLAGIMTTYGCPFQCDFCSKPIFGDVFRRRSLDLIFEEISTIKALGYDGLWIADDGLTLSLEHLRGFCRRMIREKLDMKWFCLSRVDTITGHDMELMKKAGCAKVYLGLESGSNEVLRLMNKQTTVEMAEETVALFAQSGIRSAGFFMVGYPGETYDSIEETFHWALRLPLDEVSFTIPFPLPGTRFFEKALAVQNKVDWQFENENRFIFRSDFDEEYLKKRIAEVHDLFEAARLCRPPQRRKVWQ